MAIEWKKCTDEEEWDSWFLRQTQSEFLQSWGWGEFQAAVGRKVQRWQLVEDDKIIYEAQVIGHKLRPFANYAYLPRYLNAPKDVIAELLEILKNEKYSHARFEPGFLGGLGALSGVQVKNRQPQTTMLLDLTKDTSEILAGMHAKTRYNIHLAEKKGVKIIKKKDVNVFVPLYNEMLKRDKIKGHTIKYLTEMLKMPGVEQLTAYVEGEALCSNINIGFGDTYTYLHGASGNKQRNLMAPYLLQWQCILEAKKAWYKFYDFWGVAPELKEGGGGPFTTFHNYSWAADNPWTGVTRFKVGFGGTVKKYSPAIDIPIKKIEYRLAKLATKIVQFKNLKSRG
jgi:lipid II:glycine glycyltransferase (peptidoglycan interpeptide bridge formation enzyme)